MFEQASRLALRFTSALGTITTEDLWNLSLAQLDAIAREANRRVKANEEESFIPTNNKKIDSTAAIRLKILKHIIEVKVFEQQVITDKARDKQRNDKIMELISKKENDKLSDLSIDDLKALIK